MKKILALDLSTHTGWAYLEDSTLIKWGLIESPIVDFDIKNHPEKAETYPFNMIDMAEHLASEIGQMSKTFEPTDIIIENTVIGRNRHTQRALEFIHFAVLKELRGVVPLKYFDPSEWRYLLSMRMSKEDKKNNRLVSAGKKRGRITKKHLSVRNANQLYGLSLKMKDNDIADAICLGRAFYEFSKDKKMQ